MIGESGRPRTLEAGTGREDLGSRPFCFNWEAAFGFFSVLFLVDLAMGFDQLVAG